MTKDVPGLITPITSQYRIREYDLIDITPETVKSILRGARTGRLEEQERLFRSMFETWPRLVKNSNEVADAVAGLEWTVLPYAEKGKDPTPEAIKHAETVEAALWKCKPKADLWELDFSGMIKALLDARAMGHAVLEVLWQVDGDLVHPRAYCPVPARYYAYPYYGADVYKADRLMLNPTGQSGMQLVPFPEHRFIIGKWQRGGTHPVFAATLRSLTKWWLGSYFGWGWQLQYAQLFGIPWRTIEAEGEDAIRAAEKAMEEIGAAGWAVLPKGTTLTVHDSVGSGESLPQRVVVKDADEACDVLFLGQTLTSGEGKHGTQALGTVHESIRDEILTAVADWAAKELGNQLIPSLIRLNFGAEAAAGPMPFLVAKLPEARDEKAIIERVEGLKRIGVKVSEQWLYDTLGLPILGEGDKAFEWGATQENTELGTSEAEAENEDPEQLEAARKGSRGKRQSGPKLKVWQRRSGVTFQR